MRTTILRSAAAVAGAIILASAGTAAVAAEVGEQGVDVDVQIAEVSEPGVLALSVAQGSTTLTEEGSTATERRFTGQLPEVTVTDTRTDGEQWYVTGVISDFTGAGEAQRIGAENFGWSPSVVDDPQDGSVEPGGDVDTALDDGPGLTDGWDLLYAVWDQSADAAQRQGEWKATAGLELLVPATVAPGDYSALLTLSLFDE